MKNKNLHFAYLLIFPVLLAMTAVYLNNARGPYWLGANHDPEYVYLLNALNLTQGKKIGHIDHPGTPVQMLGAVTIQVVHAVSSPVDTDLVTDVLERPEFYLAAINSVMVTLNTLMLLVLGAAVFRWTGNLWISLWLQAAPFLSITAINAGLTRVTPEPLLFFSSLFITVLLLKWLHFHGCFGNSGPASDRKDASTFLVILLAIVTSLGIAAKITFLPLIIIPLILFPGLKNKTIFVLTTIAGFVIFTFPIINSYKKFFDWIYRLLTRKGLYGAKGKGMISFDRYLENIKTILANNPFFTFVLVLAAITVTVALIIPKLRKPSISSMSFKALAALLICQSLGVLMVAKHSLSRYLLPVLMLSGILLVIMFFFFVGNLPKRFNLKEKYPVILFITIALGAFLIINPPLNIKNRGRFKTRIRDNALQLHQTIENKYKDYARVFRFGSSSVHQALNFGNNLARHAYSKILTRMCPNSYFYDFIKKRFYSYHHTPHIPMGMIRSQYRNKVLFLGPGWQNFPGLKLIKVDTRSSRETIFLLDPTDVSITGKLTPWIRETIAPNSIVVVHVDLAGSIPSLQQEYRILFENYNKMRDLHFYRLAQLLDQPIFLVPVPPYPGKGPKDSFLNRLQFDSRIPEKEPSIYAIARSPSIPQRFAKYTRFREIKVWHPRKRNNVSPSLHVFNAKGAVGFKYIRHQNRNTLTVTAGEPDDNGRHTCRIGYRFNKKGLKARIPTGKTVYLLAAVKVPAHLRDSDNFLFIDDFAHSWKRKKQHYPGTGWMTCVVFKKIRENSTGLRLGMEFTPQSPGDEIDIRDIKVFISQ